MKILGLSAFYHDSAAALLIDGQIVAAAQEERFTRKKHDSSFPKNALEFCLKEGKLNLNEIDYVAFYDKPFLKFERLLETYLATAPRGLFSFLKSMPLWLKEKLFQKKLLEKKLKELAPQIDWEKKLLFTEHHFSHAASSFYPSPFEEAAVLTMDGVGEWATTSFGMGRGNKLEIIKEIHFPHSLGLLYSAFTYYLGFKVNSGEYKVMGLAPYGVPRFKNAIYENLIDVKEDGSFRLNQDFFGYCTGLKMTNSKFNQLFGRPERNPEAPLETFHMDIAASIQAVLEEVVIKITTALAKETGLKNLCLAGGVALNCVANGKILKEGAFEKIWIQPAAGDAGGALGAALATQCFFLNDPRPKSDGLDCMSGSYLGPEFEQQDIEERLKAIGAKYEVLNNNELIEKAAKLLEQEKAMGWFQGKMEFGPRALGARSILADSRSPRMQSLLNLKIKYRESFRPFAPSVLAEDAIKWFELDRPSPYMLLVADVAESQRKNLAPEEKNLFGIEKLKFPRSTIPAVTHVDFSARIQTVHEKTNPKFYELIKKFKELTGCPVLVNTSFNVRGEPIVCTPEDAYRCFMGTEIDALCIGNCLLKKEDQPEELKTSYKDHFELD